MHHRVSSKVGISATLDPAVVAELDKIAAAARRSRSQIITMAAERFVAEHADDGLADRIELR